MMRSVTLLTLFLILLTGCTPSEQVQQKPHEGLQYPELRDFEIPEPEQFTFNGITFFLLQDDELPLINVNVLVNGGSWMDPGNKAGVATLTGRVMRSGGSAQFPEEELNELLENRAASMETRFGLTTGSASMNVLKDDFDELLPVFVDLLKNPLFPQERVDLAKTQQRTAISRRNEEGSNVATREFRSLIYGAESVYARNIEYATLNNITREDLVEFHKSTYQGSNMMVGIVGDFDPDAIRSQLEETFGILDEGEPVETELPDVEYEFEEGLFFAHKGDMNQSQIRLGHIGGYRDNPDYAALQVMNQILSGGFSGRLMREVRTDQGLAYSVYGSYSSNVRYPGVFYAGLSTAAETTKEALDATLYQIQRLQNEPVTEQELEETKERIFNRIIFRYDSYSRILSERMNNFNLGLPEDSFEKYIEQVREVTVDDIHRVANEYLQSDKVKILIVGNRDLIEDQLDALGPYEEVDISIPRPAAERAAVEGDTEAGREWLSKMASAILDGETGHITLEMEGTQYMQTPQGEMELNILSEISFPDAITLEVSTPMGTQVLEVTDGQGVVKMGGQEQQLPESMVESILGELKRDPVNIALNAHHIEAHMMDSEEENRTKLYLGGDYDLTLLLDSELYLPLEISYTEFDPDQGEDVSVTLKLTDWNASDGIRVAYDQKRYSDGELVNETVYTGHRKR